MHLMGAEQLMEARGQEQPERSGMLDAPTQKAIQQVYDLTDPPLWLVTASHEGRRGGFVATFVVRASIVAALPRMLIGVAKQHHTWQLIEGSGRFALHLLYADQLDLVWRFGLESGDEVDKLDGLLAGRTPGGSPLIPQTLAWLDCKVEEQMDSGDRTLYLAAVEGGATNGSGRPLTVGQLYANAPADRRQLLDALFARDTDIDKAAILAWRTARKST
jgi:flavin reductase (DIM6/NTAB) family NADH-FMN oxidoreductase RutF